MRKILLLLMVSAFGVGGWIYWKNHPDLLANLGGSEFQTFKMRHTSEMIMQRHEKELLKVGSSYLEPRLTYYPYLMMEVKYTKNGSETRSETREGTLLWGLSDGEMVLDVDTWAKTHGFEDCLMAGVDANCFKVLRLLAANNGQIEKSALVKQFEGEDVEEWIAACAKKKLIVENKTTVRLHLQNPRLEMEPQTRLAEWVVTLDHTPKKCSARYGSKDVIKMTQMAFGTDFAIRRTRAVYLPVFEISVKNSDNSILTTYWNALNGRQIDEHLREI